ncbi:MAG: hypothetical protein LUE12_09885 [Ruminococcus sp.]|nr:hypothetical protein [Ruminococcus sp.]
MAKNNYEHGYTTTADIRNNPTDEEKQVIEDFLKSLKEKQKKRTND